MYVIKAFFRINLVGSLNLYYYARRYKKINNLIVYEIFFRPFSSGTSPWNFYVVV